MSRSQELRSELPRLLDRLRPCGNLVVWCLDRSIRHHCGFHADTVSLAADIRESARRDSFALASTVMTITEQAADGTETVTRCGCKGDGDTRDFVYDGSSNLSEVVEWGNYARRHQTIEL